MSGMDMDTVREALTKAAQAGCRTIKLKQGDHQFSAVLPVGEPTSSEPELIASEAVIEAIDAPALKPITAPQVGRLTLSDAVRVGATVAKGDKLGKIEALSISNDLIAGFGGEIAEILVEQEASVDFGKPLLMVKCS